MTANGIIIISFCLVMMAVLLFIRHKETRNDCLNCRYFSTNKKGYRVCKRYTRFDVSESDAKKGCPYFEIKPKYYYSWTRKR